MSALCLGISLPLKAKATIPVWSTFRVDDTDLGAGCWQQRRPFFGKTVGGFRLPYSTGRASRATMIAIAKATTMSGIVMETAYPLMRTLDQLSPPQIDAAVRAAGDSADDTTAIDSNGNARFMGDVRSNSDERNAPIRKQHG